MTKQLTILQILPDLESGGVEKGTLEIAKSIVDAGHISIVISAGGQLVKKLEKEGSKHIKWNLGKKSPLTFFQGPKLRNWLQNNEIDIIHARSRMPAWVSWLAWRKMPLKQRPYFITTVHGLNSISRYSRIMTFGESVIAVSNTVKSYILENYPETQIDKIVTISRGIDTDEFPFKYKPDAKWLDEWFKNFPKTKEKFLITIPGRLTRLKGHNDFIDIIKLLKAKTPNLHGLIVGGEDPKRLQYAEEIKQRIKSEGLEDSITFTGYRSDMKNIYAISTVVVSLSTKPESFGRTVVEAISLGKAVVAYDHGGVGETLRNIYPFGLVSLGNIEEIAEKCQLIFTGEILPPLKQQKYYKKQLMLDKTLSLYEKVGSGS